MMSFLASLKAAEVVSLNRKIPKKRYTSELGEIGFLIREN
jgi:hypothetical protein